MTPRLLLVFDEYLMAPPFERRGGVLEAVHLKLEPRLRDREIGRPGGAAETRCAARLRVKIAARFLCEQDASTSTKTDTVS